MDAWDTGEGRLGEESSRGVARALKPRVAWAEAGAWGGIKER